MLLSSLRRWVYGLKLVSCRVCVLDLVLESVGECLHNSGNVDGRFNNDCLYYSSCVSTDEARRCCVLFASDVENNGSCIIFLRVQCVGDCREE